MCERREIGNNSKAAEHYSKHIASRASGGDGEVVEQGGAVGDLAEGLLFLASHHFDRGEYSTAEGYCLR
jgi:hypothetical protein